MPLSFPFAFPSLAYTSPWHVDETVRGGSSQGQGQLDAIDLMDNNDG